MTPPSMESVMTKQYGKELGARLRAIRQQQGLSLHAFLPSARPGGRSPVFRSRANRAHKAVGYACSTQV